MDNGKLTRILKHALWRAQLHVEQLGISGTEEVQKNQFGDTALRGDIAAEAAVLEVLKKVGLPIRVISEEHGTVDLCRDPTLLGVLDGLDGSTVYKRNFGVGRYGTMFGVFTGLDPHYADYLWNGILEHTAKALVFASRDAGAFLYRAGGEQSIRTSRRTAPGDQTLIYCNFGWESIRKLCAVPLAEFPLVSLYSTAAHFTDLATGCADALIECTRKGNLELAVGYGLVREAGGVIQTLDGTDLGKERYLSFGQDHQIPIIGAGNAQLAAALRHRLGGGNT